MFAASEHHVATSKIDLWYFEFVVFVLTNRAKGSDNICDQCLSAGDKVHGRGL